MHKYTVNRMTYVLELIHMDICGPFSTATRNGHVYFISFIDDYSRYGYIYLIKEKAQDLDTFKSFKSDMSSLCAFNFEAVFIISRMCSLTLLLPLFFIVQSLFNRMFISAFSFLTNNLLKFLKIVQS
jgi:hypothetical protein